MKNGFDMSNGVAGSPELGYSHLLMNTNSAFEARDGDLALATVPLFTREGLFASLRAYRCKHACGLFK